MILYIQNILYIFLGFQKLHTHLELRVAFHLMLLLDNLHKEPKVKQQKILL